MAIVKEAVLIIGLVVLAAVSHLFWWCEDVQCAVVKAARALSS